MAHFGQSDDFRRDELIRIIEHSVEKLTLAELEALYYDMSTKNYINKANDFLSYQNDSLRLMVVVSDEQTYTSEGQQELKGYDKDVLHNRMVL